MIKNYFKIAWRNILISKGFSALNIFGLAIGIACCLLIALYVNHELSYDRHHENIDRVYRLNLDVKFGGSDEVMATVSDMLGPVLKDDYPQVENFTRLYNNGSYLIKKVGSESTLKEENVLFADSSVFSIFTYPLIEGDKDRALVEPYTIVISESATKRHFKDINPIGQILTLDNRKDYRVTAVMKDMPENSTFKADFLVSMISLDYQWHNFLSNNFYTYILIQKDANPSKFSTYFDQVIQKYVSPVMVETIGSSIEELTKTGSHYHYSMIPMKDIHLKSTCTNELGVIGNIKYVYLFSIIAMFVLLLACINFMNLSTARSAKRAKEVGVRKVLGSQRYQLMYQFFSESILLSTLALLLGILLVIIFLPAFNLVADKNLSIADIMTIKFLSIILLLPILVGLIAGSYPAVFLSSFEPIKVLKGRLKLKGGLFRNSLVVFQFTTSIVLIIGTVVIYQQINYIQKKNLGYDKNQVLVINDAYALSKKAKSFKDEILKVEGVKNGTLSGYLPIPSQRDQTIFFPEGQIDQNSGIQIARWRIDQDYLSTLGMEIKSGRNFSEEFSTDSTGIILNEAAVKLFGFDDPLNKMVTTYDDFQAKTMVSYKVLGVVKDFNYQSLKSDIGALCMVLAPNSGNISFRLDAQKNIQNTIKEIENKWQDMAPGQPFSYKFMDESFNNVYRSEQQIGRISMIFAFLTIIVACLGLFGLITFVAEQKIKEIGIRKALGASVSSILQLLSSSFLKLVVFSVVIASPIAYYFMNIWLQDFAYRIEIQWWVFAAAGGMAVLIALITISYQAIKAALVNPVESLKSE
jgi:putative ABC transport system permease protein